MPAAGLQEGTLLNERYRIQATIGQGGMGAVYRALDTRLDIVVAVKEMLARTPDTAEAEVARQQFEREARLLAQLSHPNLPRVTDYFVQGDRWYLVMELIQGVTIETRLEEAGGGPLPAGEVLEWALQLADALDYLHGQDPPVVFRDLKPANVMVQPDGTVRLIDFGIARRFEAGAAKDTLLFGSPGYSPPEQYGRSQTDPRSDIYALGATLHHLLTGRDPSASPFKFAPLRSADPAPPGALNALVRRCVEMDVDRRVQSAGELQQALAQARAELEAGAPAPPVRTGPAAATPHAAATRRTGPPRRAARWPRMAGLVAAMVLAAAAFGAYRLTARHRPVRPRHAHLPAALVAPPPAAPAAAAQPATLQIATSPPGVDAWLDGQDLGPTPQTVAGVGAGMHLLRLVPRPGAGFAEAARELEVLAGQTVAVDITLAPAAPTPPSGGPEATVVSGPTAQLVTAGAPARTGVEVTLGFRVTGAAGHSGTAAAYFYGADGRPLSPRDSESAYQSRDGLLSASHPFRVEGNPTDFPGFVLFVPVAAFPPGALASPVSCQVLLYLDDGQVIGRLPVVPVQAAPGR